MAEETNNKNVDNHVLTIDESQFADDDDMLYMIRRLNAALSDKEVLRGMELEDKYHSFINNRK